jgi:hypothetical protein
VAGTLLKSPIFEFLKSKPRSRKRCKGYTTCEVKVSLYSLQNAPPRTSAQGHNFDAGLLKINEKRNQCFIIPFQFNITICTKNPKYNANFMPGFNTSI